MLTLVGNGWNVNKFVRILMFLTQSSLIHSAVILKKTKLEKITVHCYFRKIAGYEMCNIKRTLVSSRNYMKFSSKIIGLCFPAATRILGFFEKKQWINISSKTFRTDTAGRPQQDPILFLSGRSAILHHPQRDRRPSSNMKSLNCP